MEERRLTTSRGEMVYLTHGAGPPLIFFHGAIATPNAYIPLLELLGRHFSIVAPTHPGHGDSFPIDKTWTIEDFVTSYREFFRSVPIQNPLLVGHSFGGAIALLLAHEGFGTKVIGLDPVGIPFHMISGIYAEARKKEARALLSYAKDKKRMLQTLSATGTLLYTTRRHPENFRWFTNRVPVVDIRKELSELSVPVVLYWGEDDGLVPLSTGKEMAVIIPNCRLKVFPGKGHTYPVTDPEFTYDELILATLGKPWC